jgi:hypothetical protein
MSPALQAPQNLFRNCLSLRYHPADRRNRNSLRRIQTRCRALPIRGCRGPSARKEVHRKADFDSPRLTRSDSVDRLARRLRRKPSVCWICDEPLPRAVAPCGLGSLEEIFRAQLHQARRVGTDHLAEGGAGNITIYRLRPEKLGVIEDVEPLDPELERPRFAQMHGL